MPAIIKYPDRYMKASSEEELQMLLESDFPIGSYVSIDRSYYTNPPYTGQFVIDIGVIWRIEAGLAYGSFDRGCIVVNWSGRRSGNYCCPGFLTPISEELYLMLA